MALVLDTGPLLASLERRDPYHHACSALIADAKERRVIPAPVLPELDYFCARYGERRAFVTVLQDVRNGAYEIEELHAADYARVMEILDTYADLRVGFVDASILAIVERLGETKLATLDRRHFAAMRPRHTDALELLPA